MKVLIGTPIHRDGTYALNQFLANQKQIQRNNPSCELLFATCESDLAAELTNLVDKSQLKAIVLTYKVEKPDWAKSRLWNIVCGREVVRQYVLSRPDIEGLLFLDSDMTFDPLVITILEKEIKGYDAVFNGYQQRIIGIALSGAGCLLLTRKILERIKFRCYEFKNGNAISEDSILEMDLYRLGGRIKKGFFLSIDHYVNSNEAKHIEPQKIGWFSKITTQPLFRYCLVKTSVLIHYNLSGKLYVLFNRFSRIR